MKSLAYVIKPKNHLLCTLGWLVAMHSVCLSQEDLPTNMPADNETNTQETEDQFSRQVGYCLGLSFGRQLKQDSIEPDFGGLVAGLRDALTNAEPELSDEQISAVMNRFQNQLREKVEKQMAEAAAENLAKGQAFLAENRKKEGIIETPSGLQYRVIEEGDGDSPVGSDTVRCHYEGTLIDGTVFDSSYKRGQPAEFPVGGVISGWTEALQLMNVGGKWEVFLPADIAYGARGAGGAIGPNETLVFTIELIDIVN